MEKIELKGDAETQKLAGWLVALFLQRGFSFALDADIVFGQGELADYFVAQGLAQTAEQMITQIERVVAENGHLFARRAGGDGVEYYARKRKLVAPAPAAKPAPAKAAPPPRPTLATVVPAEAPITQQYRLAVLLAIHKLGGAGKAADVIEMIPSLMAVPEDHLSTYARGADGKSEQPKYVKFVQSARGFLIQEGELESPSRGVWALTPAGAEHLRAAGLI